MSEETKSGMSDSQSTVGTEAGGEGKSLAERLAEFEAATKASSTPKTDEVAALRAEVQRLQAVEADRSYRREMDEFMVPSVKGDLNVHPRHVEAWLDDQAKSNPKLLELWDNREQDRAAFEKAVIDLKPKFEAYVEKEGLSDKSQDDLKKSAVRSARGETQPGGRDLTSVNLDGMSDQEFALHKQEVFRLSAAGQL